MVEFVVWDHEMKVRFFLPRPFLLGVSVAVTHQTLTLLSLVRSQYPLPFNFKKVTMKRKTIVRERNCFVRLALFRKAGAHRKSNKALRRQHNASIAQLVEQ